jgi:hypothetical protein
MWDTHPTNYEREQNAKAYYIRSTIDNRSAWVLFKDPQHLREEISYRYYRFFKVIKKDTPLDSPDEVQAFINDEHAETTYDPRYHGLYDDRFIYIDDLDELVDEAKRAGWDEGRLERVHLKLYDNELKDWMEDRSNRCEEHRLLTGLLSGELELKDDELEFRGRQYDFREAKRLLRKVNKELDADKPYLEAIDRRAFLVYYQMAIQADADLRKEFFQRWDFHLTSQDLLWKLKAEIKRMTALLRFLRTQEGPLHPRDFQQVLKGCRNAQRSLKRILETADDLPLPVLANMKKGKPLGHFLLDKALVHSLDRDEDMIRGRWCDKLMSQIGEVHAKLIRIHFKSLGAILQLQDRIHRKWRDYLAGMPTVSAVTEEPAVVKVASEAEQVAAQLAAATTPIKPPARQK